MQTVPGNVKTMGILMLISGILNIIVGGGWALSIIIGTVGIGLLCAPVLLIPIGLGIWEIVVAASLINGRPAKNVKLISGFEIASLLWGNILSMVAGILNLVFMNDPETEAYFASMEE